MAYDLKLNTQISPPFFLNALSFRKLRCWLHQMLGKEWWGEDGRDAACLDLLEANWAVKKIRLVVDVVAIAVAVVAVVVVVVAVAGYGRLANYPMILWELVFWWWCINLVVMAGLEPDVHHTDRFGNWWFGIPGFGSALMVMDTHLFLIWVQKSKSHPPTMLHDDIFLDLFRVIFLLCTMVNRQ